MLKISQVRASHSKTLCFSSTEGEKAPFQGLIEELGVNLVTEVFKCVSIACVYRSLDDPYLKEVNFQNPIEKTE